MTENPEIGVFVHIPNPSGFFVQPDRGGGAVVSVPVSHARIHVFAVTPSRRPNRLAYTAEEIRSLVQALQKTALDHSHIRVKTSCITGGNHKIRYIYRRFFKECWDFVVVTKE